jgi:hypothetical protein
MQNFDAIDAINPDVSTNPTYFLNDKTVRAAIHAPSPAWTTSIDYPWGSGTSLSRNLMTAANAIEQFRRAATLHQRA